jgi:hypothetical protein
MGPNSLWNTESLKQNGSENRHLVTTFLRHLVSIARVYYRSRSSGFWETKKKKTWLNLTVHNVNKKDLTKFTSNNFDCDESPMAE